MVSVMFKTSLLLPLALSASLVFAQPDAKPRMTKNEAVKVALAFLDDTYPGVIAAHGPFEADFSGGIWSVYGTTPKGIRGGGAPTVEVQDRDGKVRRVTFAR
jgi:hypothetical protein